MTDPRKRTLIGGSIPAVTAGTVEPDAHGEAQVPGPAPRRSGVPQQSPAGHGSSFGDAPTTDRGVGAPTALRLHDPETARGLGAGAEPRFAAAGNEQAVGKRTMLGIGDDRPPQGGARTMLGMGDRIPVPNLDHPPATPDPQTSRGMGLPLRDEPAAPPPHRPFSGKETLIYRPSTIPDGTPGLPGPREGLPSLEGTAQQAAPRYEAVPRQPVPLHAAGKQTLFGIGTPGFDSPAASPTRPGDPAQGHHASGSPPPWPPPVTQQGVQQPSGQETSATDAPQTSTYQAPAYGSPPMPHPIARGAAQTAALHLPAREPQAFGAQRAPNVTAVHEPPTMGYAPHSRSYPPDAMVPPDGGGLGVGTPAPTSRRALAVAAAVVGIAIAAGVGFIAWQRLTTRPAPAPRGETAKVLTEASQMGSTARLTDVKATTQGGVTGEPAQPQEAPAAEHPGQAASSEAPALRTIQLRCTPACARISAVLCDGVPTAIENERLRLPPGEHVCVFSANGYASRRVSFALHPSGPEPIASVVLSKPKAKQDQSCGTFINPCD